MSVDSSSDHRLQRHVSAIGRSVLVVFAAFLSAFVIAGLGGNALVSAGLFDAGGLAVRVIASVLQFVGFGVGVAGYLFLADDWDLLRLRLPTLGDVGWTVAGIAAILVAAAVVGQVLAELGITVAQNQVVEVGQQNPQFFLYMIPVSLLFVGPFEELVFRGTVQGLLRRVYSKYVAIGAASALFGVVHWIALTGGGSRVSYIVVAGALGVILGYVYERTENLAVPAVVHGVYNSVLFGVQYAAATGLVS